MTENSGSETKFNFSGSGFVIGGHDGAHSSVRDTTEQCVLSCHVRFRIELPIFLVHGFDAVHVAEAGDGGLVVLVLVYDGEARVVLIELFRWRRGRIGLYVVR